LFGKIAESKWKNIVMFITVFAFVGTAFVGIIVYKLTGQISGAAVVNGKEITTMELNYNARLLMKDYEDKGIDTAPLRKTIYRQALENLINQELLFQQAEKEGIVATDEEVKRAILDTPAFKENGKFSKEKYYAILRNMNLSPEFFEGLLRKDISIKHLLTILKADFYVSDFEIDTFLEKQLTKIKGKAVLIPLKEPKIKEEAVKKYYEEHKKEYSAKKGKKIKVYKIDIEKLGQEQAEKLAKKSFAELKKNKELKEQGVEEVLNTAIYEDKQLEKVPEKVKSEIKQLSKEKPVVFAKTDKAYFLGVFEGEVSEALPIEDVREKIVKALKVEEKKKMLEKLLKEVEEAEKKEKDLNKLAKMFDGKIEEIKGKTLQEITVRYGIPSEDIKKIFKLKDGEMSPPIKIRNGILIVKVEKKEQPDPKKYAEMKESVGPMIEGQKFNTIIQMLIDKLKKESDIQINPRALP
jgi:peptidyl-prolyl cis-trans isomerase D